MPLRSVCDGVWPSVKSALLQPMCPGVLLQRRDRRGLRRLHTQPDNPVCRRRQGRRRRIRRLHGCVTCRVRALAMAQMLRYRRCASARCMPAFTTFCAVSFLRYAVCMPGYGYAAATPPACTLCGAGTYSPGGRSGCVNCPTGLSTSSSADLTVGNNLLTSVLQCNGESNWQPMPAVLVDVSNVGAIAGLQFAIRDVRSGPRAEHVRCGLHGRD
jgi:hypothetical protein